MEVRKNEDFNSFLRTRGIGEDVIDYLIEEKIDCSVLLAMQKSESPQLVRLFPKLGDRYAILEYCNRTELSSKKRKQSLIERLKEKLNKNEKTKPDPKGDSQQDNTLCSSDDEDVFMPKKASKIVQHRNRVKKNSRTVEIGWVCQRDQTSNLTQIRSKQGGGTRKVILPKSSTKQTIINKALDLFFPEGSSAYGKESDFDHDIFDLKQNILPDNISIESMYSTTGLSMLRFYLSSVRKLKFPASHTDIDFNLDNDSANIQNSHNQTMSVRLIHSALDPLMGPSNTRREENTQNHLLTTSDYAESSCSVPDLWEGDIDLYTESENRRQGSFNSSQSVGFDIIVDSNQTSTTKLVIHRGQVVQELIQAFQYLNENCGRVEVEMILPNGQPERALDTGGVLRDCLGEFWTSFYDQYTEGTTLKVPVITQEFKEDQWSAVAKIIRVGWEQEQYFPIKIAPVIFEQCFYKKITSDLVGVFLQCLGSSDRKIIEEALSDFSSVDEEELIEVFSNLKSKRKPTKDNLAPLLHEIAHKELVQRPFYITECWAPILGKLMPESTFKELRRKMLPTAKNILEALSSPDESCNLENKTVFNFLKKFIRESDDHLLSAFVRFCTGADVLTGRQIIVSFNTCDGIARTPVGHVCGSLLELPNTYENFIKFRNEFSSVLRSGIWVMDMI